MVCGCNKIIQKCVCNMIVGDKFLIAGEDLGLLLLDIVVCNTLEGGSFHPC